MKGRLEMIRKKQFEGESMTVGLRAEDEFCQSTMNVSININKLPVG